MCEHCNKKMTISKSKQFVLTNFLTSERVIPSSPVPRLVWVANVIKDKLRGYIYIYIYIKTKHTERILQKMYGNSKT